MRNLPAKTAALTAAYFAFSIAALASFNLGLPGWLEQVLSLLCAPGLILLAVWTPLLRPFGMVSGEWVSAPNGYACALLIAFYAGAAYLVARAICARKYR